MRIAIVCTNYNNSRLTRGLVESIIPSNHTGLNVQVVVVDNCSEPKDVAALREIARQYPFVEVLEMPENLGYFPGLNVGIQYLRKQQPTAEWIVVGNNDLEFPSDFYELVTENHALLGEHAVLSPDLVDPLGRHQNPHVLFDISRLRKLIWQIYYASFQASVIVSLIAAVTRQFTGRSENDQTRAYHLTPRPILQGYGACYMLGPAFFRQFEKLCAPTFLMQEEFFLSEQLKLIGQLPYYAPRFCVIHHHHATMQMIPRRRHWEISRAAYRIYRHYLALSKDARRTFLLKNSTNP